MDDDTLAHLAKYGAKPTFSYDLPNGAHIQAIGWGANLYSAAVQIGQQAWTMSGPLVDGPQEACRRIEAEVEHLIHGAPRPDHMELPTVIYNGLPPDKGDHPGRYILRKEPRGWSCVVMKHQKGYYGWRSYHWTKWGAERRGKRWVEKGV